jgi:hypothetical protein
MSNTDQLDQIIKTLADQIAMGILPSTVKANLQNMGATEELANKIARLAELAAA